MSDDVLKKILSQYDKNRFIKEKEFEINKENYIDSQPKLKEINNKLNNLALSLSKAILSNNDNINELKKQFNLLKAQKNELLNNLQLSNDLQGPNYDCKLCNDTGYIVNKAGKYELCNCVKQQLFNIKYNSANISNLNKDNFSTFNLELFSNEINTEKFKSNISPRNNIIKIRKICENFISNFSLPEEKNLLFTGNTGLGKTFLSSCIAYELLQQNKNVLYQSASNMLDNIINFKFGKTNNNIYDNILNVDLLIIDDLGTESINSLKFSELFNIINTRLLNQTSHITKTIISTNLTLENLFKSYDERIISRLIGSYNICRFFGDDIRIKTKSN